MDSAQSSSSAPTPWTHISSQQWGPSAASSTGTNWILPGNQKIRTFCFFWVTQRPQAGVWSDLFLCPTAVSRMVLLLSFQVSFEMYMLPSNNYLHVTVLLFSCTISFPSSVSVSISSSKEWKKGTHCFRRGELFYLQRTLDPRKCCFLSFPHGSEEQPFQNFTIVTFPLCLWRFQDGSESTSWKGKVRPIAVLTTSACVTHDCWCRN